MGSQPHEGIPIPEQQMERGDNAVYGGEKSVEIQPIWETQTSPSSDEYYYCYGTSLGNALSGLWLLVRPHGHTQVPLRDLLAAHNGDFKGTKFSGKAFGGDSDSN